MERLATSQADPQFMSTPSLSVARQLIEALHLALYCAGTQCSLMDPAGEVRRRKSRNSLRCPEAYLARTTLSTERQAASEGSEYCACRDL